MQDSANRTWGLTQWPPAESVATKLYLAQDGALSAEPAGDGEVVLRASPLRQAMFTAGAPLLVGTAVFELAVEEDLLLMGNPYVDLNVSVDMPRGMLEVALYEVDGDERELVSMGWQNLATRESRDKASDVPTGTMMPVRIQMEAIAQVIEKGNTLLLVVSPENTESLTPQFQATTFTIALGGAEGAHLVVHAFPQERTELLAP